VGIAMDRKKESASPKGKLLVETLTAIAKRRKANPNMTDSEELAMHREEWAHYLGADGVANANYMPQQSRLRPHTPNKPAGRPYWLRPDFTDADVLKHISPSNWPAHHIGHSGESQMTKLALSGGLLATEERLRLLGQWITGASSHADQVSYGSSGFIFTRLGQSSGGYSSAKAFLSPRALRRTQTYSFNGDHYGNIKLRKTQSPWWVDDFMKFTNGSNETQIKYMLSILDDIEVLEFPSASSRSEAIAEFKKLGIDEIRGIPIEKRFTYQSAETNETLKLVLSMYKSNPEALEPPKPKATITTKKSSAAAPVAAPSAPPVSESADPNEWMYKSTAKWAKQPTDKQMALVKALAKQHGQIDKIQIESNDDLYVKFVDGKSSYIDPKGIGADTPTPDLTAKPGETELAPGDTVWIDTPDGPQKMTYQEAIDAGWEAYVLDDGTLSDAMSATIDTLTENWAAGPSQMQKDLIKEAAMNKYPVSISTLVKLPDGGISVLFEDGSTASVAANFASDKPLLEEQAGIDAEAAAEDALSYAAYKADIDPALSEFTMNFEQWLAADKPDGESWNKHIQYTQYIQGAGDNPMDIVEWEDAGMPTASEAVISNADVAANYNATNVDAYEHFKAGVDPQHHMGFAQWLSLGSPDAETWNKHVENELKKEADAKYVTFIEESGSSISFDEWDELGQPSADDYGDVSAKANADLPHDPDDDPYFKVLFEEFQEATGSSMTYAEWVAKGKPAVWEYQADQSKSENPSWAYGPSGKLRNIKQMGMAKLTNELALAKGYENSEWYQKLKAEAISRGLL
jgi:hypothetical protein